MAERKAISVQAAVDSLHLTTTTVEKRPAALTSKGLISTEDASVFARDGLKRNSTLRYAIQPF